MPVSKPGSFDPSEISKQRQGELPRRYFQRIAQYFCDKLPLSPYAKEADINTASAAAAAALLAANPAPDAAAITAAIAAQVQKTVEASLLELTDHQIRQIWIHGLDKPAREAAKAETKRLTLPQLLRHVDQYASDNAKKNADNANPARTKNKKKIFEVEDDGQREEEVEEVKKKKDFKSAHTAKRLVTW